ncbi:MAG TPA: hypothetical protein PLI51_02715 [bacterium]|nr:hypothetical protein [bacterium]HPQ65629.1 hypothetical protein [bacterium]
MNVVQIVSIGFEVLVALLGLSLLVHKKKTWGAGLTLTFAVYVFYDLSHLFSFSVSQDFLRICFFVASLSILWAVWRIYKEV